MRRLLAVNPTARFSAADVLAHHWVAGGTASQRPLTGTLVGLAKIQQTRTRFRGAVQSVIATMKLGRFRTLSSSMGHGHAGGSGGSTEMDVEEGAHSGAGAGL